MKEFEEFLSARADVVEGEIPYYVQWVRQGYEMAGGRPARTKAD